METIQLDLEKIKKAVENPARYFYNLGMDNEYLISLEWHRKYKEDGYKKYSFNNWFSRIFQRQPKGFIKDFGQYEYFHLKK